MTDGNNEKVTLAVLGNKLDNLTQKVEGGFHRVEKKVTDHEQRIRRVEDKAASNEQKLGVYAMAQGTFTAVAAMLAGWFGSK